MHMATLEEIGLEKQRVSERLARLNTERALLTDQLRELEVAERVLTQFDRRAARAEGARRETLATTAPTGGGERNVRGSRKLAPMALRDAVLMAVEARPQGTTANEVLAYISQEFGLTVRPNHLGMALQRHRRAGRLELRDQHWYKPRSP
jgi:hypothetical protein